MQPFFRPHSSQNHQQTVYDFHRRSPVSSENRSSSPQSSSDQDQFFDGQPTASLNRQPPGFVRTFSQSGLRRGQYEAGTAPNVAYIERTSSRASQGYSRRHQRMSAVQETPGEGRNAVIGQESSMTRQTRSLDPDVKEAREMAHQVLKQVFGDEDVGVKEPSHLERVGRASPPSGILYPSNCAREQNVVQVQASASVSAKPVRPIDERYEDSLYRSNKKRDRSLGSGSNQRVSYLPSEPSNTLGDTATSVTINEVEERDDDPSLGDPRNSTQLQAQTQEHKDDGDYFGDSIAGEEALFPPAPPRNSFRSRSPTPEYRVPGAMRLYPTNPDPPSRNATDESLPTRLSSSAAFQRHPSYLSREPIQPARTAYPSPLRHQSLGRTATTKTNRTQPDKPTHEWDSRRKSRLPVLPWNISRKRSADGEATQEHGTFFKDLMNDVAPSQWAFYGTHAVIWLVLVGYFFWRVSQVSDTVAFDCYELKAQLVHLFGNSTSCSSSEVPGGTALCAAASQSEVSNASSILIPEQFHGMLKGHCVLRPVRSAIVLASSFEIWFLAMMAAGGITFLLESLVLTRLRALFRKRGATSWVTLGFRVGVRVGAVGIACLVIAGPAWAMKGGWSG